MSRFLGIDPETVTMQVSAAVQSATAKIAAHKAAQTAAVQAAVAGPTISYPHGVQPVERTTKDLADELKRMKLEAALRQAREIREHQAKADLHKKHMRPERISRVPRQQWLDLFAREGEDVIYNAIAVGYTIAAYGRERGFPPYLFREWCQDNLDRKKILTARKAAAELDAYDSAALFENPESSASMQAVHHVRARAQHKTWMAERRDPEDWGPPKSVAPPQAPVALIVSIDGLNVPAEHLADIEAKRQMKLANARAVFDPMARSGDSTVLSAVDAEVVNG